MAVSLQGFIHKHGSKLRQLPSQLKSITAPWLVQNYTAWCQRHTDVSSLLKATTRATCESQV